MAKTDAEILQESFQTRSERMDMWNSWSPDRQQAFIENIPILERAEFLQSIGLPEQALYYQGVEGRRMAAAVGTDVAANALSTLAAVLPTGEEREAAETLEELRAKERPGPDRGQVAADRGRDAAMAGRFARARMQKLQAMEATQGDRTSAAAQERLREAEASEEIEERVGREEARQRAADAEANREILEEAHASIAVQNRQLRAKQAIMSGISAAGSTVGKTLSMMAPLSAEAKADRLKQKQEIVGSKLSEAEADLERFGLEADPTRRTRMKAAAAKRRIARLGRRAGRFDARAEEAGVSIYPEDPQTSPAGLDGRQGVPPAIPAADTAVLVDGIDVSKNPGPWGNQWHQKYLNNGGR